MSRTKKIVGVVCCCAIVVFIWQANRYLKKIYVAPIAMYHSINPVQNPHIKGLIVHPRSFERQMKFLKQHKYNVIALEELVRLIKEKRSIPARTLVLTFDDGYKDNYTYAFPILKKYGLPATIFVIINEIGRADRLSWEEIKQMQASGLITIGSHSLGPDPLIKVTPFEKLKSEIVDSKKILEERLGKSVTLFSYPEGMFTPEIRQIVQDAGYFAAVATSPGRKFPNDDIFALKRLRIAYTSDNLFVFWFETTGLYTHLKERKK
ncbi:MAG: polysaccharide deacetylase family protein [Candidatus Omnitrophica bacterium]|nr:polysaccharide deacetylase family protein [Candidatus Omnitrophota bacterium]